ncbi:MAG: membrane protein insertion efficiency factor YidD [Legionellales bacterium]|nr:membrane protein insertion efficiency factor YidD [Legionellales bacterium]
MAIISKKIKQALISLIKSYKRMVSPWLSPSCRFVPSCSEYSILCLKEKRLITALYLITARLFRCNPFTRGGLDLSCLNHTKEQHENH